LDEERFDNAYSSPLLIDVDGLEQLVAMMDGAVIAVNPHNGNDKRSGDDFAFMGE
jgi:hypothetical protein